MEQIFIYEHQIKQMHKFRVINNGFYYSFLSFCNESKALDREGKNFNIQFLNYSKENDYQKWILKKI